MQFSLPDPLSPGTSSCRGSGSRDPVAYRKERLVLPPLAGIAACPRGTATSICTASHMNRQSDVRVCRGRRPNWPATVTSAIVEATNHRAQQPPRGWLLFHEDTEVALLLQQREPRGLPLTAEDDRDRGPADTKDRKSTRLN